MVYRLDVNAGKIINTFKEEGLENNTLVVFLSDNGSPVFSNASLNASYKGSKGILLEGGVHVPFIMSWPSVLPKRTIYEHEVYALDLAPTFLAMANAKEREDITFSGKNFLPCILGEERDAPSTNLKWRFTISAAIREGVWKLIRHRTDCLYCSICLRIFLKRKTGAFKI